MYKDAKSPGLKVQDFLDVIMDFSNGDEYSASSIIACFQELSNGKPYITDSDLAKSNMSKRLIAKIKKSFPKYQRHSTSSSIRSSKSNYSIHSTHSVLDQEEADEADELDDPEDPQDVDGDLSYDFLQFVNELSGLSMPHEGETLDNVSVSSNNLTFSCNSDDALGDMTMTKYPKDPVLDLASTTNIPLAASR